MKQLEFVRKVLMGRKMFREGIAEIFMGTPLCSFGQIPFSSIYRARFYKD